MTITHRGANTFFRLQYPPSNSLRLWNSKNLMFTASTIYYLIKWANFIVRQLTVHILIYKFINSIKYAWSSVVLFDQRVFRIDTLQKLNISLVWLWLIQSFIIITLMVWSISWELFDCMGISNYYYYYYFLNYQLPDSNDKMQKKTISHSEGSP